MKNNAKVFLMVALALIMVLSLAACDSLFGGDDDGNIKLESVTLSANNTEVALGESVLLTTSFAPQDKIGIDSQNTNTGSPIYIVDNNNDTTRLYYELKDNNCQAQFETEALTRNKTISVKAQTAGSVKAVVTVCGHAKNSAGTGLDPKYDHSTDIISNEVTLTFQFIDATAISIENVSGVVGSPLSLMANLTPTNASNTNITYELIDNTIGATLTGNQVASGNLGIVSYKAKIGNLESNTATITFGLNSANGETITTAEQFNAIRNNLSGKYQLGNDIDLSGYSNWTPIGTSSAPFTGTLSGNGYTVQNLTISSLSTDGSGLFGQMNGTVTNLKLSCSISANQYVGGIAGRSKGTISNCEVSGNIGKNQAEYVGGIAGHQTGGNISNNINNAIIVGANYTGGIAGYLNFGVANGKLENCQNNGVVTGLGNVGGIIGSVYAETRTSYNSSGGRFDSVIQSCINNAQITGTGNSIGGVIGNATSATNGYSSNYYNTILFNALENNEAVTGVDNVGGVLGFGGSYITEIKASQNSANITGSNYVGGYIGRGDGVRLTGLTNSNTIIGRTNVGGIAGRSATISSCINQGQIQVLTVGTGENIGGIAGYVVGSVTSCSNNIAITTHGSSIGGIVGYMDFGTANNELKNCINEGTMTGLNNVGGIAGNLYARTYTSYNSNGGRFNSSVNGCQNSAIITGAGSNVGGIVGKTDSATNGYSSNYYHTISFNACQNSANIIGVDYIGGIFGNGVVHVSEVLACENTADITGGNYVGSYAGAGVGTSFSGLTNINTISGKSYVGGIAGQSGNMSNNINNGAIIVLAGGSGDYIGGIVGSSTGNINNCTNEINITTYGSRIGGIAGNVNFGTRSGTIGYCVNNGAISGSENVGGIIGYIWGSTHTSYNSNGGRFDSKLIGCVNNAAISGTGNNIGGIAGQANTATNGYSSSYYHTITFDTCENKSNVSGNSNIAGILGFKGNRVQNPNLCSNTGTITANTASKWDIMQP